MVHPSRCAHPHHCIRQPYLYIYQTRTTIRAEAIITQLIYEHALRLRTSTGSTKKSTSEDDAQPDTDSFLGRLNTLVTTDLQNIINGRDFILILVYIPLNVVVGIAFLYSILGWR